MKEKRLILILAAALLIVLAGIGYLLSSGKLISTIPFESSIVKIETQSTSDETASIEKDLNETDLSDLDKELTDIEAELNAAQ